MYELFIANKNYSSWSMRPWVLMRALGIGFTEQLRPFHLNHGRGRFPDVLAIRARAAASLHGEHARLGFAGHRRIPGASGIRACGRPGRTARAWARCAAAEMHSGFAARCATSAR